MAKMPNSQPIKKRVSRALPLGPGTESLSTGAPNLADGSFDRPVLSGAEGSDYVETLDLRSELRACTELAEVTNGESAAGEAGPPTVAIHTHGCKLNQADSEALARSFAQAGYRMVEWADGADVLVLNTCTITATADAKARQALRGARRANSKALVVATGCYAQRAAKQLAKVEGVSLVVGNTGKDRLVATVTAALDQAKHRRLSPISEGSGSGVAENISGNVWRPLRLESLTGLANGRTRAMIKIQEGCDQVCAYCIVPKVRGRERSIHPDVLLGQINQRISQGCQEVVLTGTQLGTYGFDLDGCSLSVLLQRILRETGITRLRMSSLQPQEITHDLLELWSDPRLCPHFHLPLQSGCDQILKSMRRRYDTSQFAAKVDLVRKMLPSAGITTDIIVGFPHEGAKEYQASQEFARSIRFSDMHVFPYSPRPGTSAAYLRDRPTDSVRKERVADMGQTAAEGFRRFRLEQLGGHRPVLWESSQFKGAATVWTGLTDNYIRVRTESESDLRNVVTQTELLKLAGESVLTRVR